MRGKKGTGWFALLVPALICVPCLLAPVAVAGGGVALAAAGGFLTGNFWLVVSILLLGSLIAGGLYLRLRTRRPVHCDTKTLTEPLGSSLISDPTQQPASNLGSRR